ncbi:putative bifunctional diguanylate cyclase/phosphodiesterase [Colwellia piezophila]|uniref:putative bifunctional diguanylate cyclase/phosphodiesterase n=1 Tax=Colwellia piezophila TaxID=211668 RepID=UPI00039A3B85|nr:bifunctional diguanylate cyclase/phosphodiesterase [Colwellia piezophila]
MESHQASTWKLNTLFVSVFLLLVYLLLITSMAKNPAKLSDNNEIITVNKTELVNLTRFDKLMSTVLLMPKSYLYQGEIFITLEEKATEIRVLPFENLLISSFIDIAIPVTALLLMALTSVVVNALYYHKNMIKKITPLCHKVDGIISTYQLDSSVNENSANLHSLTNSLNYLQKISEEYQLKAEEYNFCDKLTKLVDRYHFLDHINKQLIISKKKGIKSALLFIDLDGFKSVNDSYGHSFGDEVLIQVAERLKSIVRRKKLNFKQDDSVLEYNLSRLGGDEFTMFIRELESPEQSIGVAIDVLKELERDFILGTKIIKISASIGIAIYPDSAATPYALIQMADVAMYRAKTDGRGVYRIYSPEMGASMRRYHYLLDEMRAAIDSKNFFLTFQPVIDIDDYGIIYFEALVRWQHPVEGTITPDEFIPIAESSNLILELGDWILDEACRQMSAWYNAGMRNARISVNLSAIQLKHKPLDDWIFESLEKAGLPPRSLMLEITESCFIDASDKLFTMLENLRAKGVLIAIDDFGTGFSSLSILANLPVDVLKIDKIFVSEAMNNSKYNKILHSIVDMAKKLDLNIVAEGIEQVEQLEMLRSLGVQHIQGFLVSRPQRSNYVGKKIFEQGVNHMAHTGTSQWAPQVNDLN